MGNVIIVRQFGKIEDYNNCSTISWSQQNVRLTMYTCGVFKPQWLLQTEFTGYRILNKQISNGRIDLHMT